MKITVSVHTNAQQKVAQALQKFLNGELARGWRDIIFSEKEAGEHVGTCIEPGCKKVKAALQKVIENAPRV